MAKTDIKSAFRTIPIHPADFELLGMKWDNLYYYDQALPMGCSTSCSIFESFSIALEWIAISQLQVSAVLHVLDDFFYLSLQRKSVVQVTYRAFWVSVNIWVSLSRRKK